MEERKTTTYDNNDPDLMIKLLNDSRKKELNHQQKGDEVKLYNPQPKKTEKSEPKLWHFIIGAILVIGFVALTLHMIPRAIRIEDNYQAEICAPYISAMQEQAEANARAESEWQRLQQRKAEPEIVVQTIPQEEFAAEEPIIETIEYALPSAYYYDLDFWSFQPYMDYRAVTDTSAPAYGICHNPNAWTDACGFRRIGDDYIIALGTFYNEHGTVGSRWLIETTEGSFTAIVGDEKQDVHTDAMNMYGVHDNGTAGMIEYVVDTDLIPAKCKTTGTMTSAGIEYIGAEIIGIERIEEDCND